MNADPLRSGAAMPSQVRPGATAGSLPQLTIEEQARLLGVARRAMTASIGGLGTPEADLASLPPVAAIPLGCFVTLTVRGQLRGCIGNVIPRLPLHVAIARHAIAAACEDRRFNSIARDELPATNIEISILGQLRPLRAGSAEGLLRALKPGHDGVMLKARGLASTYLPKVWQDLPDPLEFMQSLARKAGLPADAWRDQGAEISVYEVMAFAEGREPSATESD